MFVKLCRLWACTTAKPISSNAGKPQPKRWTTGAAWFADPWLIPCGRNTALAGTLPKTSISCGLAGASLWGPCEHAYCCMGHEGKSSTTSLPKAKPKGRPSHKAKAISSQPVPSHIIPGSERSKIADTQTPSSCAAEILPGHLELRSLLRSADLGRFYQPMVEQSVALPALDFFTFFGMSVGEAHALMQALGFQATARASISWFPEAFGSLSLFLLLAGARSANNGFTFKRSFHTLGGFKPHFSSLFQA